MAAQARSGTRFSALFYMLHGAAPRSASIPAGPASRPAAIHVDDVGSGYLVAIERLPLIAGTSVYPVFDLATSKESLKEILEVAAKEMGFKEC
jgi:hypothetical protein